jgi:NADH dehydrogenase (ubiquinone) 1 alpha subcomplex subunit 6
MIPHNPFILFLSLQAAEIQAIYPLDVPVYQIRRRMRQEFEKNRFVRDLDTINVLLFKGWTELEETLYFLYGFNMINNLIISR